MKTGVRAELDGRGGASYAPAPAEAPSAQDLVNEIPPVQVMHAVWSAWANGSLDTVLSWYAEDAVWTINLPRELIPFGGESRGKAAIADALTAAGGQFETLYFHPEHTDMRDGVVRCFIKYGFKHRLTGLVHEDMATYRCVVTGGLVRRVDAVYDIEQTRAFMGVVSERAAHMANDLLRLD